MRRFFLSRYRARCFFLRAPLFRVQLPDDVSYARFLVPGHLLEGAQIGLRRLKFPVRLFKDQLRRGAFVVQHLLPAIDLFQTIVFAAPAGRVGLSARGFEPRRDDVAFERTYPGLSGLQSPLSILLGGFEAPVGNSGQQLSLKNLLAHFHEECADHSFSRRGDADHMLRADLPGETDIGNGNRSLRRRRGLCLLGRSAP